MKKLLVVTILILLGLAFYLSKTESQVIDVTDISVTAHGDLSGLTTGDDHTQYLVEGTTETPTQAIITGTLGVGRNVSPNAKTVMSIYPAVGAADTLLSARRSNGNVVVYADSSGTFWIAGTMNVGSNVISSTNVYSGSYAGHAFLARASGSASQPTFTWNGDTDLGLYRVGPNRFGITAKGVDVAIADTSGIDVTGDVDATGAITGTSFNAISLLVNGTGTNFLGGSAGVNNTGSYANGFGQEALQYNTGANSNGFGYFALRYNTGASSSAFGYYALRYNTGINNTALGHNAFDTWTGNTGGAKTFDYTAITVENDYINIPTHGFGSVGAYNNLRYVQGTSVIPGLSTVVTYQFKVIHADTIQCRTDITAAGTGTGHTLTPGTPFTNSTALGYNAEPNASNQIVLGDTNVTNVKTAGSITLGTLLNMTPLAARPDTTGMTGGNIWYTTGDSLYVYKYNHTIGVIFP